MQKSDVTRLKKIEAKIREHLKAEQEHTLRLLSNKELSDLEQAIQASMDGDYAFEGREIVVFEPTPAQAAVIEASQRLYDFERALGIPRGDFSR